MDILKTENVEKLVKFYIDNAVNLCTISGVEADAEIKIRIVPNRDKNIDAQFVIVGSGKVVIPGQEEVLAQLKAEEPTTDNSQAPTEEPAEQKPELEVVK